MKKNEKVFLAAWNQGRQKQDYINPDSTYTLKGYNQKNNLHL
jgi:hypothetical protein